MLVIRRLFGTGTNCIAPSGLPLLLCLFPGLAPWAFLSRPCGASFAPETRIANGAFSKRVIRLSFFRAIRGIRGQAFSNLLQCHVSLARGDHFRPGTPAPFPARDGLGSGDLLLPGVISAVVRKNVSPASSRQRSC